MTRKPQRQDPGLPIPRKLVELILLGHSDDGRQLQDSPLLGDVWLAYAAAPKKWHDLLLTPHMECTAGRVAKYLRSQIKPVDKPEAREACDIAYLHGIVVGRFDFGTVLRDIVPATLWWTSKQLDERLPRIITALSRKGRRARGAQRKSGGEYVAITREDLVAQITLLVDRFDAADEHLEYRELGVVERFLVLAGLILWASTRPQEQETSPEELKEMIRAELEQALDGLVAVLREIKTSQWARNLRGSGDRVEARPLESSRNFIFSVSLNRRALPAIALSVPAVKADAARLLFKVNCEKIAWAVVDSGIDRDHPAFSSNGKPRIRKSFDFTRIRKILSFDQTAPAEKRNKLIAAVTAETALHNAARKDVEDILGQLVEDAENERPHRWGLIEQFVSLENPLPPNSEHGTHVAGIIGAGPVPAQKEDASGMCPDIQLYDFRVLAKNLDDTEFAIIAALQYIRYINELHSYITIHGANLSLSIPHNVRNFACGRTPLCKECERLVESGVVVVAAAGNRGYQSFETKDGIFENYAAFSITDPGNADGVICVGSTHRSWPHTYGVSFYSSRGPTGDGRMKPDLVAPGERIRSTTLNGEYGLESGTSMAAPHVSGAAAMLMARYPEMIGQPRRIKQILCQTATDLGRERSFQGHGMLDVLRAFQSI